MSCCRSNPLERIATNLSISPTSSTFFRMSSHFKIKWELNSYDMKSSRTERDKKIICTRSVDFSIFQDAGSKQATSSGR